jgi:hypothetical protein
LDVLTHRWRKSDRQDAFMQRRPLDVPTLAGPFAYGVIVCLAERGRERNSKSRMRECAPPPAAALRAVLEFAFLSREIAFSQSMTGRRRSRRAAPSPRSGEGGPKGRMGCGKQVWIDARSHRWSCNPTCVEAAGHTPSGASRHPRVKPGGRLFPSRAGEGIWQASMRALRQSGASRCPSRRRSSGRRRG